MNTARLQAALDQVLVTTRQRWMLMIVAVASIGSSSLAIVAATPFNDTWVVFCVVVLALVVAMEPSEQLGLVLMGIVVFHWLALKPAVTSPWAIALALGLFVFHTVVALMAVTPHSAVIHRLVLLRWFRRSGWAVVSTVGVWAMVYGFEQRNAQGNVALSALAFAVLGAAVVGLRQRTRAGRA